MVKGLPLEAMLSGLCWLPWPSPKVFSVVSLSPMARETLSADISAAADNKFPKKKRFAVVYSYALYPTRVIHT